MRTVHLTNKCFSCGYVKYFNFLKRHELDLIFPAFPNVLSLFLFFFYNILRPSFLSLLLFSSLNSFLVSARCHFSRLFTFYISSFPFSRQSTSKILQNWLQGSFFFNLSLYCRLLNLKNRIYQRKEESVSVLLFAFISCDIYFLCFASCILTG